MTELEILRSEIDEIDSEIAELFAKRMHLSLSIAEYKRKNSLPIYDKAREQQVTERGGSLIPAEISSYYKRLLECIMSLSREYQTSIAAEGGTK